MPGLTIAGATALAGGLAALGSAAGAGIAQGVNYGNSKIARHENYLYNEMAADNAYQRQLQYQRYLQQLQYKQYYDLESPGAIMEQLRSAGLSPSLYAAGNAGGNISGIAQAGAPPQGAGASGIGAPYMSLSPIDFANIRLAMAQAEKAHEEANTMRGENAKGQAEIENIIAKTLGENAKTLFTEMQTKHEEILTNIDDASQHDQIDKIHYDSAIAARKAEQLQYLIVTSKAQSQIAEATVGVEIEKAINQNELLKADKLFRQSSIRLNDAEVNKINDECQKWQQEMLQEWWQIFIKDKEQKTQAEYVKNLRMFQDNQIENLRARLQQDENHFTRTQKLEYYKLLQTLYDNAMERGTRILCDLIPTS